METVDGSTVRFVGTNTGAGYLIDRDGIIHGGGNGLVRQDSNGNKITTYSPQAGEVHYLDSLGRDILSFPVNTADLTGCVGPRPISSASLWTIPAPSGGTGVYKFCYATVPIKTNFQYQNHVEFIGSWLMLQSVVQPNGTAWTFEYDSRMLGDPADVNYGELTKIIFPTGGSISYSYANVFTISGMIPSRLVASRTVETAGLSSTWAYSWGTQDASLNTTNFYTDPDGNDVVYVTSPVGRESEKRFYQGSQVIGTLLQTAVTDWSTVSIRCSNTLSSDTVSFPIRETVVWANGQTRKTEWDYDSALNLTTCTVAVTSYGKQVEERIFDYGATGPGGMLRRTSNAYKAFSDVNYKNWNRVDLLSSVTVYDGSGTQRAQTTYVYDEFSLVSSGVLTQLNTNPANGLYRGNPTSVRRWLNTTGALLTTTNKYFNTGMPERTIDPHPDAHTTTFIYGTAFAGAYLTRTTNHLGHNEDTNYDLNTGLPITRTDPNGRTTSFTYDIMRRLDVVNRPDGGWTDLNYSDQVPFTVTATTKIDDFQNLIQTQVFDGLGRLTQTQLNSNPGCVVKTDIIYDALGRRRSVSNPYCATSEVTYGATTYDYDALDRIARVIPPDGTTTSNNVSTIYSGNSTTVTDQQANQRRSFTDALGRVIQVDEPNPTLNVPAVTSYTHDTLNNLIQVLQSGSRQRTFAFDSLSRLTSAGNPESGTITYTYDNDGNLITRTDARGIVTTHSYDPLHRLTQKSFTDGTSTATFTYDVSSVDGLTIQNPIGRLVKAATSSTGEVSSYDASGRVASQWQCTPLNCGTGWYSLTYSYNAIGQLRTYTDGAGHAFTQGFNPASQVIQLESTLADSQHPAMLVSGIIYNAAGATSQMTLGNGLIDSQAYNNRLQPIQMRTYDPVGSDILMLTYGFTDAQGGNNGNVISWAATGSQTFSRSFTYDELNRLKTMSAPGEPCSGLSWTYNIWANRTHQTPTGGTCGQSQLTINNLNRISDAGYGYDASGNLTSEPGKTFEYDAENRMISINNGAVATHAYGASGRRTRKTVGGAVTEFVYDLAGNVVAEFQGTTWTRGFVYLGGRLLAQYSGGTTYFAHKDHLGSTRVLTRVDKSVHEIYDYMPYGESNSSSSTTSHKFTGKERDGESGLDYFLARYYSSNQGRFLSPDEFTGGPAEAYSANDPLPPGALPYANIANPQTLNKYCYVTNNPLRYVDPDGHDRGLIREETYLRLIFEGNYLGARAIAIQVVNRVTTISQLSDGSQVTSVTITTASFSMQQGSEGQFLGGSQTTMTTGRNSDGAIVSYNSSDRSLDYGQSRQTFGLLLDKARDRSTRVDFGFGKEVVKDIKRNPLRYAAYSLGLVGGGAYLAGYTAVAEGAGAAGAVVGGVNELMDRILEVRKGPK